MERKIKINRERERQREREWDITISGGKPIRVGSITGMITSLG